MKNGFTLLELLGVIVIISIISSIAFIVVDKTVKDNKQRLYDIQVKNIYGAADMWATDNINVLKDRENYCVSLSILQNNNYIDKELVNPLTDEAFDGNLKILITDTETGYTYSLAQNNEC